MGEKYINTSNPKRKLMAKWSTKWHSMAHDKQKIYEWNILTKYIGKIRRTNTMRNIMGKYNEQNMTSKNT